MSDGIQEGTWIRIVSCNLLQAALDALFRWRGGRVRGSWSGVQL